MPYQQQRHAVGNHLRLLDEKQGSQQAQNKLVRRLAEQPGACASNQHIRSAAGAYVQLLSLLSTVQSSNVTFATSPARIEERRLENRIYQADALYQHQRVDQAIRRESDRNSGAQAQGKEPADVRSPPGRQAEQHGQTDSCPETGDMPDVSALTLADRPAQAAVLSEMRSLPYRAVVGAGQAVSQLTSWLDKLPGPILYAHAAPAETPSSPAAAPRTTLLTLNETATHDFLATFVGGEDGKFMADEIGKATAGKELLLTTIPQSGVEKRAALADLMAHDATVYHEYLRDNCHIRTKTVAGHPIGDGLLVAGEYARNPWRGMAEALNKALTPGREMTANEVAATEYFNIGSDIGLAFITVGLYPIIKYGMSKSLSIAGQATNGDKTCLKREFSPEEMARLLFDTEVGITSHHPVTLVKNRPAELAGAATFKPSGLFVEQHFPSGIQSEKYLSIQKDGVELLIREKLPGQYVTVHPHAPQPDHLEQRVFFDPQSQRIFFSEDFVHGQGYDVSLVEGKKFIELHGEPFELHHNRDKQQLEVKVEQGEVTSRLPVYKEKLSHTWHLDVRHNDPVFSDWQKTLIKTIKVNLDGTQAVRRVDNLNPGSYGSGSIYEVRKAGALPSDAPDLHVVELHGELVPVRMIAVEGHGVRYETYDLAAVKKQGRPVEWDGQRWIFEKNTSVHVAPALKKSIDAAMFDGKITARDLSAPDHRGVQWDAFNRGFLKIKGGFVRVRQCGYNPDAWFIAHDGTKTNLHFRENRFYPENFRHRLRRINTEGMSGRGAAGSAGPSGQLGRARERTAEEIIQDCFGLATPQQARQYLQQFHFEPHSLLNERQFALYVESYNRLPRWATRIEPGEAAPVQVPVVDSTSSGSPRVHLDAQIGQGAEGSVYLDAQDNSYVFKKLEEFFPSMDAYGNFVTLHVSLATRHASASRDVMLFNRYYGEGMAETIVEDGQVFIRMPRIPGVPLNQIARGQMPDDGVERYVDMLERLSNVGIWHGDLHANNIMFDPVDRVFYPIDFSNVREDFFAAGRQGRARMNFESESAWIFIVAAIRARMNRPGLYGPQPGPSRP